MTGINVLSLFNGCSMLMVALKKCGIKVNQYFSSEIDKPAIIVSQANFPEIIQLGDVKNVRGHELPKIDICVFGFPCQSHSFAGKGKGFDDPRGQLFFEAQRILMECKEINPALLFIGENTMMKKKSEYLISESLGVEPIKINATLVSAQSRNRNFWTNILAQPHDLFGFPKSMIPQPKDRGILLKDILQPADEIDEKYYLSEKAIARIFRKVYSDPKIDPEKAGTINTKNNSGQLSFDSGATLISDRGKAWAIDFNSSGKSAALSAHDGCAWDQVIIIDPQGNIKPDQNKSRYFTAGGHSMGNNSDNSLVLQMQLNKSPGFERQKLSDKSYCLDLNNKLAIFEQQKIIQRPHGFNEGGEFENKTPTLTSNSWEWNNLLQLIKDGVLRIRRLTEIECSRLQGLPDDFFYKDGKLIVSSSQTYKQIGNGFNVDVIAHILSFSGL